MIGGLKVIKRQKRYVSTGILIILFHLYCCNSFEIHNNSNTSRTIRSLGSNREKINNYFYSMKYDPAEILTYKGESFKGFKSKEGYLDSSNNFAVTSRVRKSIYNGKADIGIVASNEQRTYPGSLLLANSRLVDNIPDVLSVNRAPLKCRVNLPGLTEDGNFTISPSFPEYQSSLNRVVNKWFEKYPLDHNVNAIFHSDQSLVYSKEQLRVKFGTEVKGTDFESSIDFDAVHNGEKAVMVYRFKQIFYTVSVESPNKPADLFSDKLTLPELLTKFNSTTPPLLVDSVSYGRVIYVKIETSSADDNTKLVLENILKTEASYIDIDYNLQVYVMGGSTEHIALLNSRNVRDVNEIIERYGKFSRDNLGFPISYSCQCVKDNRRAVVMGSTEYTETTRSYHKRGIIKISHTGWFVAQFKVEWDEISYDENGNKQKTHYSWHKNMQDLTAPYSTEIELSGNSENIHVFARECTGLAWEWWRTVFDRSGISLIDFREFSVWGSTLKPKYSIQPPV